MSFGAGQTMTIKGVVNADPKRFTVNIGDFSVGNTLGDIALHVDLRFDYSGIKNTLVLNSYLGEKWGSEIRTESFPFHGGKPFKITIEFSLAEFLITCNDLTAIHFRNSMGQPKYDTIDFQGDASISSVIIS
ncbi:beta-galactoside-binding lectin-like [Pholidichthys leucotaenia]